MRQVPVGSLAVVCRVLAHGGHDGAIGQGERAEWRGEGEFRKEVTQGALQKQKCLRMRQAWILISVQRARWHMRDKALVEIDVEIFRIAFFKFAILFVHFFFEIRQTPVECLYVVFDACKTAMKRVVHLLAFELGQSLLFRCRQWRMWCHRRGAGLGGA